MAEGWSLCNERPSPCPLTSQAPTCGPQLQLSLALVAKYARGLSRCPLPGPRCPMARASILQTSFARGTCNSPTRTKSRPGPRALSLLCPCDGEPPMCTPCIHKPWALDLHRWEAPAGARIWGWCEVPGRAGPKRRVPGYPPFRGSYFVTKRRVRWLPAVCRRRLPNFGPFS